MPCSYMKCHVFRQRSAAGGRGDQRQPCADTGQQPHRPPHQVHRQRGGTNKNLMSPSLHQSFFPYMFWRARVCSPLPTPLLMSPCPFCIFERCLDSNPESCRSKQARYQLSHPSPSLATHLPLQPPISHLSQPSPSLAIYLPP